jgi:hypothetical protein
MDFLCPSCQKMLTVPDQYAGTLMKCPLCANTFQAPALPTAAAPPPPPPPPPPPRDVYTPPEEVAVAAAPSAQPARAPAAATPGASTAPLPPPSTGDYTGGFSVPFRYEVFQYIAPVCVVVVFFLMLFFPWLGLYPGGYGVYEQGVWRAAAGWIPSGDADSSEGRWKKLKDDAKLPAAVIAKPEDGVDRSPALILYLLVFFPALIVTVGAAVLPHLEGQTRLHPTVTQLQPWRWALAAGLCLLALLLLLLPLLFGFPLENRITTDVDDMFKTGDIAKVADSAQTKAMARGAILGFQQLHYTVWLKLTVFLMIVAAAAAGLTFWLERRAQKPVPRLDFRL